MARRQSRIRIDNVGNLEVVDPGYDSLGLVRALDPGFQVRRSKLRNFMGVRLNRTRDVSSGLEKDELSELSLDALWKEHDGLVSRSSPPVSVAIGKASILDLKIEIARRVIQRCSLCTHRCGVDRVAGETGICRLGIEAIVAEYFVHIAEEPPINPSLVLNLAGCGLRCRFCQQWALLDPGSVSGEPLAGPLWSKLKIRRARSLSFVGGNPDESLYAILRFLSSAPHGWKLPIVWNNHSYATSETLSLLDGVVDVFIPDLKYANDSCGRRLSGVANYAAAARENINSMLAQDVPVIVRILVLPGHLECCHIPALEYLSTLGGENLLVSVRGQYCPDWKINSNDGDLTRRASHSESLKVSSYAEYLGLRLIRP